MTPTTLVYARRVTKQTWTAAVSAALFVLLAAIIALVPVPFVSWSAGATTDLLSQDDGRDRVEISGVQTYPVTGQLRLTTVSVTRVDAQLTLPEAILSYWLASREVLPRGAVYPAGLSADQVRERETQMMDNSQDEAVAAALRAAKLPVSEVPQVAGVSKTGPANDKLKPGDFVLSVDRKKVATVTDVQKAVQDHQVGDSVVFGIRRDGVDQTVTITTTAANSAPNTPVVGIRLTTGYLYAPSVNFHINSEIGGPSAGLMFALAVYDKVTPGDLVNGRSVAGTGGLSGAGQVEAIGGIQEKIAAAERAGSSIFFVPAPNCPDVAGLSSTMRLVKVAALSDAIQALEALGDPARAPSVPGCQ